MNADEQVGTLCVSRRPNESITLDTSDGPVTIRIESVMDSRVRLKVTAKRRVRIRRDEAGLPAR